MSDHPFSKRQLAYLSPWFEDVSQVRMESLGVTGGFSGAVIWRVSMAELEARRGGLEHDAGQHRAGQHRAGQHRAPSHSDLCLRRWPQVHPSLTGLQAIHGLLSHVTAQGYEIVPMPRETRYGETYFVYEDHLWELTSWLPGEASFASDPTALKLTAAMQALARFHQAAQTYRPASSNTGGFAGETARLAPSPGLQQRLTMIKSLQQGELQQLWSKTRTAEASDLRELAFELLEGTGRSVDSVGSYLEQIVDVPLPLQWCLRDVRHDHVLFTGEEVSGLLDFGAVAVDSVAGDLSRLLGSIVNDHAETWQAGIVAYSKVRQLSLAEQRAIIGFDHGGLLCSATNWVRWLFVEGRSFPQIHALHAQLLWLRDRLQSLTSLSTASAAKHHAGPTWAQSSQKHSLEHQREHPLGPSASSSPQRANGSPWMHT